jgi:predicted DNA-binding protein
MTVANRISVSFDDEEYIVLERLSAHSQKSKAQIIRMIVTEYLQKNPERFRLDTNVKIKRTKNIVLED